MKKLEEIFENVIKQKRKAKNRRDIDRFEQAIKYLDQSIQELKETESENGDLSEEDLKNIHFQLSDCYGIMGGIYRRWGLSINDDDKKEREEKFLKSCEAYEDGYSYEKRENQANSYNMLNRLISKIFYDPGSLNFSEEEATENSKFVINGLEEAKTTIENQIKSKREKDVWALADLALVNILLDQKGPIEAFSDFVDASPPDYAYISLFSTLEPLSKLDLPVKDKLQKAVEYLEEHF